MSERKCDVNFDFWITDINRLFLFRMKNDINVNMVIIIKKGIWIMWKWHIDKSYLTFCYICSTVMNLIESRENRGRDRMVVGFITTCAINVYHHYHCAFEPRSGEASSIYIYKHVIKFVSDLRQVGGLLRVLGFPPPIKVTATI